MIDTHCHLNFEAFDADREAVLQQSAALGVHQIIIPAVDLATSQQAIALAERYPGVYAAVGIHPNSASDFAPEMLDTLRTLAQHPRVVAIGEIGLDYYWDYSPPAAQAQAFAAQLALAQELKLPVIIHDRDAHEDTLRQLEAVTYCDRERPGVLHSVSAPLPLAKRALELGFYLGFTGPITYKKAEEMRAVAAAAPRDRLLVETDAPFLTPEPHRGKRNTPQYIPLIVDRLAALHQMTSEEMAQITTQNAQRLFHLPARPHS
jgi:TatD DNase family protein